MNEPIRKMTAMEQIAYRTGCDDAQRGSPMNAKQHDFYQHSVIEAYERGYRNFAGEAVDA